MDIQTTVSVFQLIYYVKICEINYQSSEKLENTPLQAVLVLCTFSDYSHLVWIIYRKLYNIMKTWLNPTIPQNNWFKVMVFNATFNNISAISWRSVLLVEETEYLKKTTDLSQTTDKLYHIMLYRLHLTINWVLIHNLSGIRY